MCRTRSLGLMPPGFVGDQHRRHQQFRTVSPARRSLWVAMGTGVSEDGASGHFGVVTLPEGWTLGRVREHAQAECAELIASDRTVPVTQDGKDYEPVDPSVILYVGGLYLVLARDEDDDWMMGAAEDDDTIVCWNYYGPLADALRALLGDPQGAGVGRSDQRETAARSGSTPSFDPGRSKRWRPLPRGHANRQSRTV